MVVGAEKPRAARQLFPSVFECAKHPVVRLSVACGLNEMGEFTRTESESMELALGASPGAQGTSLVWAFKEETRLSLSFGSLACEGGDSRDFPMRNNANVILFPEDMPIPKTVMLMKAAIVLYRQVTTDATRWTPVIYTSGVHGLPEATTRLGSSGSILHVRGIQLHGEMHVDFMVPGLRFTRAEEEEEEDMRMTTTGPDGVNMVVATVQLINIVGGRDKWEHLYPISVTERLAETMADTRGIVVNSTIIELFMMSSSDAAAAAAAPSH